MKNDVLIDIKKDGNLPTYMEKGLDPPYMETNPDYFDNRDSKFFIKATNKKGNYIKIKIF